MTTTDHPASTSPGQLAAQRLGKESLSTLKLLFALTDAALADEQTQLLAPMSTGDYATVKTARRMIRAEIVRRCKYWTGETDND